MGWVSPIKDEETLRRFKEALRKADEKYYIMFEIGIGTGLLLQDILKLKVKDVAGKESLKVYIGAHRAEREFVFPDYLINDINTFIDNRDKNAFLFTGHNGSPAALSREQAYRVFKSVGKSVGLSTLGAQTMRKTFAWTYYKETNDITYLQQIFNHASPSITYRYIGEKPNIQVILRKNSPEENERSRYLLYLNDTGKNRINAAIAELNKIKDQFNDPTNSDSFYGCVDCFLEELDILIDNYKSSIPD